VLKVRDAVQMRLNLEKFSPVTPTFMISTFRPVTRDDSQNLGELLHKAYEGTVDDEGETVLDAQHEVVETVGGKFGDFSWTASLVSEIGNSLVSSSLVTILRGIPLLAFTVTLPQYQNKGIGSHIISQSAELLRDEGFYELRLVVTRSNPAINLYRRLGFVEHKHRSH
jgi:ribosomal protein S18 acetylase RimI-like enzyme